MTVIPGCDGVDETAISLTTFDIRQTMRSKTDEVENGFDPQLRSHEKNLLSNLFIFVEFLQVASLTHWFSIKKLPFVTIATLTVDDLSKSLIHIHGR
jgi:hypothetical protein